MTGPIDLTNPQPRRIACLLVLGIAAWEYYALIDGVVRRPARAQHRSPSAIADDLARSADAHWRTVSVTASDGARLEGWLFVPMRPNHRGVLITHGMGRSRLSVLDQAGWLLRGGYTCLVPDGRAHGTSGGSLLTYGLLEQHDIAVWIDRLRQEEPDIETFFGLGVSLGGSILMQAAAAGAPLRAIIADSAGADDSTPYQYLSFWWPIPRPYAEYVFFPLVEPLFLNARIRYRLHLKEASPVQAIRSLTIPVLLIHGSEDRFIPIERAYRLQRANPRFTQLWEVPEARHERCAATRPTEYRQRIVSFLESSDKR